MKLDLIRKIIVKAPQDEKERAKLYASVLGFKPPTDEEWEKLSQPDECGNRNDLLEVLDAHLDSAQESQLETILKKLGGE